MAEDRMTDDCAVGRTQVTPGTVARTRVVHHSNQPARGGLTICSETDLGVEESS
jgi:hypothetical protein